MYRILGILPILITLFMACSGEEAEKKVAENTPARITNIAVQTVQADSLIQFSRLPATAKAWHDANISALESGVVLRLNKNLGDRVKRGDVLAELDLDLLRQAAIEAEASLKFQTYNYNHSKELVANGSISDQAHQAAEYDYKSALSRAKSIRTRLAYGRIKAPFSGRVAQRYIDVGQLISQGSPAFRLVQIDSIRIEAWVSESEIVDFDEGRQVTLTLDSFTNETFQGTIGKMGTAADTERRVYPIEVRLANPDNRILPGMIGKLKIVRRTYRNVVVVKREAILERETGPVAFVATNNNTAELRPVTLGPAEDDRVVITKGLSFGDHVIIKGNRDLIDGDPVQIQQTDAMP